VSVHAPASERAFVVGRPLAWPKREDLTAGVLGGLGVAVVFFPVYLGAAAVATRAAFRWRLYADWELALPFWPLMIVPYLSLFVLFLTPPLQLRARELWVLTRQLIVGSLIGGVFLAVLPTGLGFPERHDAGVFQGLYDAVYRVDGPVNAAPSFHVLYTAIILLAMREAATPALRRGYLAWLVLVGSSTVLTHRHHLLDVAGGLALAVAVGLVFPLRIKEAAPCDRSLSPPLWSPLP